MKHGETAFVFEILEEVLNVEDLILREQYWIDKLEAADPTKGFNMAPVAGSSLGRKHPPEVCALMRSKSRKGQKLPPRSLEHSAAISAAKTGVAVPALKRSRTKEERAAQSAKMRGRVMPWVIEANKRRRGEKKPGTSIAMMGNQHARRYK